jgi:hypothetical protein
MELTLAQTHAIDGINGRQSQTAPWQPPTRAQVCRITTVLQSNDKGDCGVAKSSEAATTTQRSR